MDMDLMREDAKGKYWTNVSMKYTQVMEPDLNMVKSLLDFARHGIPLERFAYSCGILASNLFSVLNGTVKHGMSVKDIYMVSWGARREYGMDDVKLRDMLFAANGLVESGGAEVDVDSAILEVKLLRDEVRNMNLPQIEKRKVPSRRPARRRVNKPATGTPAAMLIGTPGITSTGTPGATPNAQPKDLPAHAEGKQEVVTSFASHLPSRYSYDAFMEDLCFYARGKDVEQLQLIKEKQKELYKDKVFCTKLHSYRLIALASREGRVASLKNFYQGKIGAATAPDGTRHGLDEIRKELEGSIYEGRK